MTNQINFYPSTTYAEQVVPPPTPTKNSIPDWYKKSPRPVDKYNLNDSSAEVFLKNCVPFRDSFMMGYVQKSWAEILIEKQGDDIIFATRDKEPTFGRRDNSNTPTPDEFYEKEFIWRMPWFFKLPKGYSAIVTHPFNRSDLPFQTFTAIIDSDKFIGSPHGNIPFLMKKNFFGVIPVGTPLYQIIPFKREDWNMRINSFSEKVVNTSVSALRKIVYHSYQKQFWQKKNFN